MNSRRFVVVNLAVLAWLALLPGITWAQTGAIAGVVKDTTGAVLPGVTVEAASPALIEKVRIAVTDGAGQYRIVDLRPGTYTVTFTLPGFSTFRREGIELNAGGTVNVAADMPVGTVEETVMVSGAAPTVDIQNVVQHRVVTHELIEALPVGRNTLALAALVPGVTVYSGGTAPSGQDVGGTVGASSLVVGVHGSKGEDMALLLDGMRTNLMNSTGYGAFTSFTHNPAAVQEIVVDVGGHSAETMVSGVRANVIAKQGGNQHRGLILADYTDHRLQANNIGPDLVARGVLTTGMDRLVDINPAIGGPIKQDKLWYFASLRHFRTYERPAGAFYSKDPLAFVYPGPDLTRPALASYIVSLSNVRLTWQASARNKFNFYTDHQDILTTANGLSSTVSYEATRIRHPKPMLLNQISWNAPVTNRLLFDAGLTVYNQGLAYFLQEGTLPTTTAVQELSTGVLYRAATSGHNVARNLNINYKASMSYVTGSHAFKVGSIALFGHYKPQSSVNNDMVLQFLNGVPRQVQIWTTPFSTEFRPFDLGVFAQDQWTMKRLTLNLGARFDYLRTNISAQDVPPVRFVGRRTFPEVRDVPNWKDITTRIGGGYDLFGDGKTAIKAFFGKFLESELTGLASANNPLNTSVNNTTRLWNDLNGNFDPDCDMLNPDANGECGGLANRNFGKVNPTATVYDPDLLRGWGKRVYNWEAQASIQHELASGVSVTATYTRHWNGNFVVQDNLLVEPSDYSEFCVTAPVDPRLSGGGRQPDLRLL